MNSWFDDTFGGRHEWLNCGSCFGICSCPLRLNELASTTTTTLITIGTLKRNRHHLSNMMAHFYVSPSHDGNTKIPKLVSKKHAHLSTDLSNTTQLLASKEGTSRKQQHPNPSLSLIGHLLLVGLCLATLATRHQTVESIVVNGADQTTLASQPGAGFLPSAHYPPPSTPAGPSLCPLVPACQCKWSNGKQGASCERRNLATIPAQLPHDTQVLDMSGNHFNQLAPHIFLDKHLTNLQRIFLSDCKISFIADDAFAHLTNLIELDLSHNQIQQVPIKSFGQLSYSLRKLSLAYNPIQQIEQESFASLSYLNKLDLSNCQLSQLKQNAFHGLGKLKELKLIDNRLSQLPMNVISDLSDYAIVDLFGNPWHCDCELRQSIDWMSRHHIQQSIIPACNTPQRHKDIRWHNVKPEEFICPPIVINKQNELVVGAGSNVSLACTARGSPPLTFVWFQDEKNLTTARTNVTDPPSSTKLLEEKRYEIAEELGPPGHPNITTSILYLFNLKLTDTSLFLCWVENAAGYTVANFSLLVTNDSPPAQLTNSVNGATDASQSFWRSFGLSPSEAQMGIISIGFIIVLVVIIIMLLIFKHSNSSSSSSNSSTKSSKSNDLKKTKSSISHPTITTISASNKFSASDNNNRRSMLAESEDDDDSDERSSSGSVSSCQKSSKMVAASDLNGFIEHMRSGIINMDYHSMSPVIQFNNTLKSNNNNTLSQQQNHHNQLQHQHQQQQHQHQHLQHQQQPLPYLDTNQAMHHFQSASNASSVPYGNYGNGSTSMATTMSDLSPSQGSGNTQFANNNGPITNCDIQLNDIAPATNTTTTSYTSDYQSGYSEEPSMPAMYYDTNEAGPMGGHPYHPNSMYNATLIMGPPGSMLSHPQQQQHHHLQQQQQQHGQGDLVLQEMMHSRLLPNQRHRLDSGFHIL